MTVRIMSADGEQGGVLLPCPNPWCEGVEGVEASRHIVTEKWHVCCDDCMIEGPWADTCDLAFTAWNTRATPATDTPEVVRLREAASALLTAMTTRALRGRDHVPSMRDEQNAKAALAAALAKHPTSPEDAA